MLRKIRTKDIILLAVVFGSLVAGGALPDESRLLAPFMPYMLMGMLFLAFLRIVPLHVWHTLRRYWARLPLLILTKLVFMPVLAYLLARIFLPSYTLALVLLAGVSTGLSAPFFSAYVGANISLVLAMSVVTTLLLPLTLPLLVKILVGQAVQVDLPGMVLFLAAMIFVPLLVSNLCQWLLPRFSHWLDHHSYPISLVLVGSLNLAAFGLYAPFLKAHLTQLLVSSLVNCGLGVLLALAGIILFWTSPPPEKSAAAGALGWLNNILALVLGIYVGDARASVLAALYLIPYYGLIIPLGYLAGLGAHTRTDEHR